MAFGPAAQSALLCWLNSFPIQPKVEFTNDLTDGLVFSKVLADIDHSYAPEHHPRAETLRDVVLALLRYIRTQCEDLDALMESPSLKVIIDHGKSANILEIAVSILMAAISGPDREKYVVTITELDASVQAEIASIIQKKQREIADASTSVPNDGQELGAPIDEDFELEFEARYGSLIAQKKDLEQEKERLRKQLADITTRLERLQDNNNLLQERLTAAEDGLHGVAKEEDIVKAVKSLEAKIRELDEVISSQESQLEQDGFEKAELRKEIERLEQASQLVTSLQDKNKELQIVNLELTKKSNALDRYKQKLESQRDFQALARKLTLDNEELKLQFRDNELLRNRNEILEATHVQFQNTLANRETEIFELSSQKKTLDEEKADLHRALMRLEELKSTYEDRVTELSDHIRDRAQTPVSNVGPSMGSLEDELGQNQHDTRLGLELSRLKAENQLLKGNVPAAQEAAVIRTRLGELEKTHRRDEARYNELFEKHVISSQQLTAVLDASTAEGSEAFGNLRKTHLTTLDKISELEKKNQDMEAILERTRRDLLTARTDLDMIAAEEKDAIQILKSSQETLSFSIGEELKNLQNTHKDLQDDYEQQKSLLIQALVSKDKLQQAVTDLTEQLATTIAASRAKETKALLDRTTRDITEAKEQTERQENVIAELQDRIKQLEAGGNDTKTAALEKEIRGIQREYDLMITAWYDLTGRLQSNNVALQRREHAPKSWIKGQRSSLNPFGKRPS